MAVLFWKIYKLNRSFRMLDIYLGMSFLLYQLMLYFFFFSASAKFKLVKQLYVVIFLPLISIVQIGLKLRYQQAFLFWTLHCSFQGKKNYWLHIWKKWLQLTKILCQIYQAYLQYIVKGYRALVENNCCIIYWSIACYRVFNKFI